LARSLFSSVNSEMLFPYTMNSVPKKRHATANAALPTSQRGSSCARLACHFSKDQ
jgi:hypothetical protein